MLERKNMAKLSLLAMKPTGISDQCTLFVDIFPESENDIPLSADPITFSQRKLWDTDTDKNGGLLTIPLDKAKELAKQILEL
jgi:hypothetical protein